MVRIAKKSMSSKVALYYAKAECWIRPFAVLGVLMGAFLRKMCHSRTEEFLGVPVYFIVSRRDLSGGSSLLKGSAELLNALSPFWARQAQRTFSSIVIHDFGSKLKYDLTDRCWIVNPLLFAPMPEEERIVRFTMELIAYICVAYLYQGRFGYFGVKNCHSISLRAIVRFLRKCNSKGACSDQLSWCYQEIDKVRPGRRCYERFMFEESRADGSKN